MTSRIVIQVETYGEKTATGLGQGEREIHRPAGCITVQRCIDLHLILTRLDRISSLRPFEHAVLVDPGVAGWH